jgi:hypothetical protein
VADLDRDGLPDLISAACLDDSVRWHRNVNAASSFAPGVAILGSPDCPVALAVADFDQDGDLDVASASSNDDTIAWAASDGNGSFAAATSISTAHDSPRALIALDVDGDGDSDLVAASVNDDEVGWFENRLRDPAADFAPQSILSTAVDRPVALSAADFDRDGDLDLAVAGEGDGKIVWLSNQGSGSFVLGQVLSDPGDFSQPQRILAVDADQGIVLAEGSGGLVG